MGKWENTLSSISIYILSTFLITAKCNFPKEIGNIKIDENFESLILKLDTDLVMKTVRHLNYPVSYWNEKIFGTKENDNCVKFPRPHLVDFENLYWQIYKVNNVTFRLYNAYLDNRERMDHPMVRILAMVNDENLKMNLKCLLWYNNGTKVSISDVSDYMLVWHSYWVRNKIRVANLPYLINCPVPRERIHEIPVAVTLTEKNCQPTSNVLKVIYDKVNVKQKFAICVKGLDFPFRDVSAQLVEWIELARLLGVNKIFIYNFQIHPNALRVLEYYEKKGFIEVIPLTYSLGQPHILQAAKGFRYHAKYFEQVIAYNDCWNKNMYKYDFISLLDVDEMIIPAKVDTWSELIDQIETKNELLGRKRYISYVFREARFSPEMINSKQIPGFMTMTRRILRKEYSGPGWQVKSIHDTKSVITLHNHYFVKAFDGYERIYEMDPSIGQVSHYRNCDVREFDDACLTLNLNNGTIDRLLWKYYTKLKPAVENAFREIKN